MPQRRVLAETVHGTAISPYLGNHVSAKYGGAHLMLRLRKERRLLAYLPTHLYVPVAQFDPVTKQVVGASETNRQLVNLFERAVAMVTAAKAGQDVKAQWAQVLVRVGQEQKDAKMSRLHEHFEEEDNTERYALLRVERQRLEAELRGLDADIETRRVALNLPLDVAPVPAGRAEQELCAALLVAFLVEQEDIHTPRDYQMWASWAKVLKECCTTMHQPLHLMGFTLSFYNVYKEHLMVTRGNLLNTFGAQVKKLKAFFKFVEQKGHLLHPDTKHKKFKIREEEKAVVYLDDEELDLLWEYRLVRPTVTNQMHMCLFQSLTGLRIGDLRKHHSIVRLKADGELREYLTGTCTKNKGKYKIPVALDPRIKEILIEHSFRMDFLTETVYNREIKVTVADAFAYYKRPMPQVTIKREDADGEVHDTTVDMNKELTTHSNRRSFISRHINSKEFNQYDILSMIGSKDTKELEKYISIDNGSLHGKAKANFASRTTAATQRKIRAGKKPV